jgi:hypothetical protein
MAVRAVQKGPNAALPWGGENGIQNLPGCRHLKASLIDKVV